MFRFRFYLLLAVIYACTDLGQGGVTTEKPILLPIPPSPVLPQVPVAAEIPLSASDSPSPVNTKPQPDPSSTHPPEPTSLSTHAPTHTPTTMPTPTTTLTPTTTPAPTTTSTPAPTTTSTPAPTTTSAPAPTPTPAPSPAPGPLPPPDVGTWTFTDYKNVTCIVVQFAAQLNVTYTGNVNGSTLSHVLLNVPANATVVDGRCSDDAQVLVLSWAVFNSSVPNNMTLVYTKNETLKNYALEKLRVDLSPDVFVNANASNATVELSHGPEWQVPLSASYRCDAPTRLNMTSEATSVVATLTLARLQEEAFRTTNGTGFSAARVCSGGDVPDAVPIAVGCALGGLVVVVMVSYLVARRRSAARGYLSM